MKIEQIRTASRERERKLLGLYAAVSGVCTLLIPIVLVLTWPPTPWPVLSVMLLGLFQVMVGAAVGLSVMDEREIRRNAGRPARESDGQETRQAWEPPKAGSWLGFGGRPRANNC